jgi:phospholipid/cholesterol/gamma-HCH transport system permease protein
MNVFQEIGQVAQLIGRIIRYFPTIPKNRKLVFYQMEQIGVNSLPLVLIIAVFTGAVSAWQAAYQLKGIAPMSFLGGAVARAIITELGPVLTGIVIAGRVGASIAAELGTMKVTEQIDALEIMAISPIRYLAMPRFIAAVFMLPLMLFQIIFSVFHMRYFLLRSRDILFCRIFSTDWLRRFSLEVSRRCSVAISV